MKEEEIGSGIVPVRCIRFGRLPDDVGWRPGASDAEEKERRRKQPTKNSDDDATCHQKTRGLRWAWWFSGNFGALRLEGRRRMHIAHDLGYHPRNCFFN